MWQNSSILKHLKNNLEKHTQLSSLSIHLLWKTTMEDGNRASALNELKKSNFKQWQYVRINTLPPTSVLLEVGFYMDKHTSKALNKDDFI